MAGADDFCPPAAPPALQQTAPEGGNRRGKPRTHDACNHKQHCRYCRRKEQGNCKRLPTDCEACSDEQEKAADALAAAAGSSAAGSTLPLTSSMALRVRGEKKRVEEGEEQEEDMEGMEEE